MSRLTHVQLLLGDGTSAREMGYSDAMRGRALEPGSVPKNVRSHYCAGYARAAARVSAERWASRSNIHSTTQEERKAS